MALSAHEAEAVLDAVEKARTSGADTTLTVHGWIVTYQLRKGQSSSSGAPRGDLHVRPPQGPPLFSVISVKRKLGLVAGPEVSADDHRGEEVPKKEWRRERKVISKAASAYDNGIVGVRVSIRWPNDGVW